MDNSNDQVRDRVYSLAMRQFESALSPAERAEFETLLLESSEARRAYVQFVQESAWLRWLCGEECTDAIEPPTPLRNESGEGTKLGRMARFGMVGGLACILVAAIAAFQFLRGPETDRPTVAANVAIASPGLKAADTATKNSAAAKPARNNIGQPVATITGLSSARWSQGREGRLLTRYAVGDRVRLSEGSIELTFDAGAQVTVFGPADFKITSPTSMLCAKGRVTALVDNRAKGFTVQTPQAKVVDLGTQFGLAISDQGETEVVVFQGSVDLSSRKAAAGDASTRRMLQGEAVLLKNSGEFERVVSVQRNSFMDAKGYPRGFEPVIGDVSDNIRKADGLSVKSYQIVHGGLEDDALCFVDRYHQWNGLDTHGLPDFLVGADYIMPFNDDKFVGELEINVRLLRPSTLYVFLDNNMKPPAWLQESFTDTGVDIGMDCSKTEWHLTHSLGTGGGASIDFPFSVWKREVKGPETVKLGGVSPPEIGSRRYGFNMYGIAAVAKD